MIWREFKVVNYYLLEKMEKSELFVECNNPLYAGVATDNMATGLSA